MELTERELRFHKRRIVVRELVKKNEKIPTLEIMKIAKDFECSRAAVYADIVFFRRYDSSLAMYPSTKTKNEVKKRDNDECQYCGYKDIYNLVDHVIPSIMGGVGVDYNLVVCCYSCNLKKKKKIFIPKNIELLRLINEKWASFIELGYTEQIIRKNIDLPKHIVDRIDFKAAELKYNTKKLIEETLIDKFK